MNSLWLVICYLLGAAIKGSLGYIGCTDTSLNYQGYTYTIDPTTQQKVWSHCGFPNPSFDYALCGLTYTSGEHFLCDPDGLLSSQLESKTMSHIKHMLFGQLKCLEGKRIGKPIWCMPFSYSIFQPLSAEVHRSSVYTIIETFLKVIGYKLI